ARTSSRNSIASDTRKTTGTRTAGTIERDSKHLAATNHNWLRQDKSAFKTTSQWPVEAVAISNNQQERMRRGLETTFTARRGGNIKPTCRGGRGEGDTPVLTWESLRLDKSTKVH